jgi:uncharacterized protein with GYD domain
MPRLVTRGRFTHDYLKGLLDAPEDREVPVRKVVEAAGGKVISFYVTTGESDFLLISEADESEAIIAALMTAAAAGTISDVSTGRAWTGPFNRFIWMIQVPKFSSYTMACCFLS